MPTLDAGCRFSCKNKTKSPVRGPEGGCGGCTGYTEYRVRGFGSGFSSLGFRVTFAGSLLEIEESGCCTEIALATRFVAFHKGYFKDFLWSQGLSQPPRNMNCSSPAQLSILMLSWDASVVYFAIGASLEFFALEGLKHLECCAHLLDPCVGLEPMPAIMSHHATPSPA